MAKHTDLLDKKKVLKSIKSLPDRFSVDDVVDRMIILEKIERAIADSEAGRIRRSAVPNVPPGISLRPSGLSAGSSPQ